MSGSCSNSLNIVDHFGVIILRFRVEKNNDGVIIHEVALPWRLPVIKRKKKVLVLHGRTYIVSFRS
jgi:hypothetical protein